jgi:hypothetical protein
MSAASSHIIREVVAGPTSTAGSATGTGAARETVARAREARRALLGKIMSTEGKGKEMGIG